MSDLDFKKMLLINEFKTMAKGKKKEEIIPLLLAVSNKAKQSGINFTSDDISIVIDDVKEQLSPQERQLLPELLKLLGYQHKI